MALRSLRPDDCCIETKANGILAKETRRLACVSRPLGLCVIEETACASDSNYAGHIPTSLVLCAHVSTLQELWTAFVRITVDYSIPAFLRKNNKHLYNC